MHAELETIHSNRTAIEYLGEGLVLTKLGSLAPQVKSEVMSLGIILDSDLHFKAHIKKVTKAAFFHLRNIAMVRPFLSQQDGKKLVHAFI